MKLLDASSFESLCLGALISRIFFLCTIASESSFHASDCAMWWLRKVSVRQVWKNLVKEMFVLVWSFIENKNSQNTPYFALHCKRLILLFFLVYFGFGKVHVWNLFGYLVGIISFLVTWVVWGSYHCYFLVLCEWHPRPCGCSTMFPLNHLRSCGLFGCFSLHCCSYLVEQAIWVCYDSRHLDSPPWWCVWRLLLRPCVIWRKATWLGFLF